MRIEATDEPIVLSVPEFDVICAAERITDRRHIVLDVPSPGATRTERAELVSEVWSGLRDRGLAEPGHDRVDPEFADLLGLLHRPDSSIDARIWADRSIRALASQHGRNGLLTIVDGDVVELRRVRSVALAQAAVSVAGSGPPGAGRAVNVPNDVLREASDAAGPDHPQRFIDELRVRGVGAEDASTAALMADGMGMRGQFGAEVRGRGGSSRRAERVIGFHDTPSGRFLHVVRSSGDGRRWSTIAPSDNERIAEYVRELLAEMTE